MVVGGRNSREAKRAGVWKVLVRVGLRARPVWVVVSWRKRLIFQRVPGVGGFGEMAARGMETARRQILAD